MTKNKRSLAIALCILWIITIFIVINLQSKLTYLEYQYVNESEDGVVEICDTVTLEESFSSPYDMIRGFSVKVLPLEERVNSVWNLSIKSKNDQKVIYDQEFETEITEEETSHFFEFDRNVNVTKGDEYILDISVRSSENDVKFNVFIDESDELNFAVYGGDKNYWWSGFIILIVAIVSLAIVRAYILLDRRVSLKKDGLLGAIATFVIVLGLVAAFSALPGYTDELDNIRGGMLISRGAVLYRDYVTQHTPVVYYLCGIFALLGACSLQQFRLSYFFFEALIWAGLYYRHERTIGRSRMLIIAIAEKILIGAIIEAFDGYTIISESLEGLCLVVLLLEFVEFCKDRKIDWGRAIILSAAIWGCVGSAFISAYPILIVALAVLAVEISWNIRKKDVDVRELIMKYVRLMVCVAVPFLAAILYFGLNHSLYIAFRQFYLFNREVYPHYGYVGNNFFEPFLTAFNSYYFATVNRIVDFVNLSASFEDVKQFILIMLATVVSVVALFKSRIPEGITLFAVMIVTAARGYGGMHSVAAWYVVILIIALYVDLLYLPRLRKAFWVAGFVIAVVMSVSFCRGVFQGLSSRISPITENECRAVSLTEENEKILLDTFKYDSLYLIYKNRIPANRLCYMLPWYLEWYEQWLVEDLASEQPRIVMFNTEVGYGIPMEEYTPDFSAALRENYIHFSDDINSGWEKNFWIRTQ